MKLSQLRVDSDLVQVGVWVNWAEDVELLVRRLNNPEFEDYFRRATQPFKRQLRSGENNETLEQISRKGIAKHVLVDWKGLQEDDGSKMEYTWERALELLNDDRLDLLQFVNQVATSEAMFRKYELEEDASD